MPKSPTRKKTAPKPPTAQRLARQITHDAMESMARHIRTLEGLAADYPDIKGLDEAKHYLNVTALAVVCADDALNSRPIRYDGGTP